MDVSDIFSLVWSYCTFRNVLFGILSLPLVTMLVLLPFSQYLSKSIKEWIGLFGVLGMMASSVGAIEAAFRTIGEIVYHLTQKPQVYFDLKRNTMAQRYDSFDSAPIVYLIVLAIIASLSGILADYYYNNPTGGRIWRRKKSDVTPLNLNE